MIARDLLGAYQVEPDLNPGYFGPGLEPLRALLDFFDNKSNS
jgi:hypothetical protein